MIHIAKENKRRTVGRGPFTSHFLPLGRAIKDSDDHGIAQIGRLEHATLKGGSLVPMHLHQNEEILSYLRKGTMRHEDSHGIKVPIHNKYLMMMNAGSGIQHEESVHEGDETVEMLQIFIRPEADDLKPDIQFLELEDAYSLNQWRLIAGHKRSKAPLCFRSEVQFYDLRLGENHTVTTPELQGLTGFMYMFDGSVELTDRDEVLQKGDSLLIKDEQIELKGSEKSDIVFFVLNESAPYTRNGLYTK